MLRNFLAFLKKNRDEFLIFILIVMFILAYFESLRWPFPGPKATHGILKGLGLLIPLYLVVFYKEKIFLIFRRKINLFVFIFFFSFLISAVFSQVIESSLLFLWYPYLSLVVIISMSMINFRVKDWKLIIAVSFSLVFVTFAFSFFSLIFRYSIDNLYYFIFLDHKANFYLDELRTYGKYVSLGPYIMLSPLCYLFLLDEDKKIGYKLFSFLALVVSLLTAVISNNRIDALVFFIHFVVLMFLLRKKIVILILLPVIFIVWFGLLVTKTYFGFNLEQRIFRPAMERDLETIDMRYVYWQTAITNFKNYPILGSGPNTYNDISDFVLRRYYDVGVKQYTVKPDYGIGVHNVFFERLSDTGLVGFFAFLFLLFYFLKYDLLRLIKFFKQDKKIFKSYCLIALSSWTWLLYSLTDNGYGAQGFMIFFFLRAFIYNSKDKVFSLKDEYKKY